MIAVDIEGDGNKYVVEAPQNKNSKAALFLALLATSLVALGVVYSSHGKPASWKMMKLDEAATKLQGRFPRNYEFFSHNMYEEAGFQADIDANEDDYAKAVCGYPTDNYEVFVDSKAVKKDLYGSQGYTVFNLDCRDTDGMDLMAWILIISMNGDIVAGTPLVARAEHVTVIDSSTVLYSTVGGKGAYLWNWRTGDLEREKFIPDAHTIAYIHSRDTFYGLLNDKEARIHHSPSVATEYDHEHGDALWSFPPPVENAHVNFLSLSGDNLYLSMRSAHALFKVNRMTNEVDWVLGGLSGTVDIIDINGEWIGAGGKYQPWSFQHKFQHIDDRYMSMFDNHVDSHREFIDGGNSRMVILEMDEFNNVAKEKWVHDTGDQATIYGSADLLPTGNVLGNSYHQVVDPSDPDRKYHVNIWEVTPDNEIAWRVGFMGRNPWDPEDTTSVYSKSVVDAEQPVGWLIYNAERFYESPVVHEPCVVRAAQQTIRIAVFNSVKAQEDLPGIVRIFGENSKELLYSKEFSFHKAWLPRIVSIPTVDAGVRIDEPWVMVVENSFGEKTAIHLGSDLTRVTKCLDMKYDWIFDDFDYHREFEEKVAKKGGGN